jgi:hypothetical protein
MVKNMIELIFEELKKNGMVGSSNEFSRDWLRMEKSYMRCLRAKQRSPSSKAMAACATRLRHVSNSLSASNKPNSKAIGQRMASLADSCINSILEAGVR